MYGISLDVGRNRKFLTAKHCEIELCDKVLSFWKQEPHFLSTV
jgi:hypothetical protein